MKVYEHPLYKNDINYIAGLDLPWEKLKNCSILISGSSGLLASCFIDVIMHLNREKDLGCIVYALGRDIKKAKKRFEYCWEHDFTFLQHDINQPLSLIKTKHIDYVLHLASNTHPLQYSNDPIGTITTNIIGTYNMLECAVNLHAKRMVFASSNEIYGENRGDQEFFDEGYCGYIDCNTQRAGYPESKRCGEALCQAYIKQKGLDVVIPRFTRSYGPTMQMNDTKAISQFILKAISGNDIVLKSEGKQFYSYTYMADAVSGLFYIMLKGKTGTAYNIADEKSDIMLKDLSAAIAKKAGRKVVFELPDATEAAGYSKATKARLDGSRLKALGWNPRYEIQEGVSRTIDILSDLEG